MRVRERISAAWSALLGRPPREVLKAQHELLSIRRELANARMDMRGAREALNDVRAALDDMESREDFSPDDLLNDLFVAMAAPLSQLRMQNSLMEAGKDISPKSIMALVRQLSDIVEKAGMEPISRAGEQIVFDPRTAEPLTADSAFAAGELVVTKFNGYRYRGRIIRKALVAKRQ